MLKSSAKYGNLDQKLYALSHYWKGEAYYRYGDYQKAIDNYNPVSLHRPGVSEYE